MLVAEGAIEAALDWTRNLGILRRSESWSRKPAAARRTCAATTIYSGQLDQHKRKNSDEVLAILR